MDSRLMDTTFWPNLETMLALPHIALIIAHTKTLLEVNKERITTLNTQNVPIIYTFELNQQSSTLPSYWEDTFPFYMETLDNYTEHFEAIVKILTLQLNAKHGGKIVNYTLEAIHRLKSWHWSHNFAELEKIIKFITIQHQAPIVDDIVVKQDLNILLAKPARKIVMEQMIANPLFSLNDYIMDLIEYKLAENQGNLDLTANELQISRTTLYNYLNKRKKAKQE